MRLFSYHDKSNKKSIGVLCKKDSDEFVDVCATDASIPADLGSLIAMDPDLGLAKGALSNPNAIIKNLSDIEFDILIDRPGKIVCMGLNYADHAKEGVMRDLSTQVFLCADQALLPLTTLLS